MLLKNIDINANFISENLYNTTNSALDFNLTNFDKNILKSLIINYDKNFLNYEIDKIENLLKIYHFYLKFPKFNIEYYKNFTTELNNLDYLELINHFNNKGIETNTNYLKFDFCVNNYINKETNKTIIKYTSDNDEWRSLTNDILKKYYNKDFYIYNEESFYQLYNDFDYNFYKGKYNIFNDDDNTKFNILKYYHLIGKNKKHLINNKIKIIIYTRPLDISCGGIVVLHNLAKQINNLGNSKYYAKIFTYNNIKYDNIFCTNFANLNEINDNTVVIYPEVLSNNPLESKTVIRWILLELGIEMPIDHYKNWDKNDIIYHWETKINTKQLCVPFYNTIFTNVNPNKRNSTCYLIKKGRLMHKKINFYHNKKSINIDNLNLEEISRIFNESQFFYCYDPNSAFALFAVACGCITVLYPLENVSKKEYFENRMYNNSGHITNYGIAYGNTNEEIQLAKSTLNNTFTYKDLFDSYKITINNIFEDLNNKL